LCDNIFFPHVMLWSCASWFHLLLFQKYISDIVFTGF
jgi:hypothetical protein